MAAEQKARAAYERILDLTDDPDVRGPIKFLREREVVHFQRFGELLNEVQGIFGISCNKMMDMRNYKGMVDKNACGMAQYGMQRARGR